MYASQVKDRKLTFAVSGMLWQRSLVMIDKETRSLWSHLLGEAMRGELKGTRLRAIPSLLTDWRTWRAEHPDTSVLLMKRTSQRFLRDVYKDPKRFVLGMSDGEKSRAWPYDQLLKQRVVNDKFLMKPILVAFDPQSGTAFVYDRNIDGQALSFSLKDGKLLDDKTGSQWDMVGGKAVSGVMQGKQLKPLVGIPSYRRAWDVFHPDSKYWKAN